MTAVTRFIVFVSVLHDTKSHLRNELIRATCSGGDSGSDFCLLSWWICVVFERLKQVSSGRSGFSFSVVRREVLSTATQLFDAEQNQGRCMMRRSLELTPTGIDRKMSGYIRQGIMSGETVYLCRCQHLIANEYLELWFGLTVATRPHFLFSPEYSPVCVTVPMSCERNIFCPYVAARESCVLLYRLIDQGLMLWL